MLGLRKGLPTGREALRTLKTLPHYLFYKYGGGSTCKPKLGALICQMSWSGVGYLSGSYDGDVAEGGTKMRQVAGRGPPRGWVAHHLQATASYCSEYSLSHSRERDRQALS
jgi:hypothetical protein